MHKQTPNSFLVHSSVEYHDASVLNTPPTHEDMYVLQKALLTPGIHHLIFHDVAASRKTLQACLPHWNKMVGHLSVPAPSPFCDSINLYDLFILHNYTPDNLDCFFIDYGSIDLLWIELTPQLKALAWLSLLEKNIIDFNIQNTIPIIIVSFPEEPILIKAEHF